MVSIFTVRLRYAFRGIISLAVNIDETSAVNVERITIPIIIQTAAYTRARKDLGDLSPYLIYVGTKKEKMKTIIMATFWYLY